MTREEYFSCKIVTTFISYFPKPSFSLHKTFFSQAGKRHTEISLMNIGRSVKFPAIGKITRISSHSSTHQAISARITREYR